MKSSLRSSVLSLASAETLKKAGLWMIIGGLAGEAILIIFVPSGTINKALSVFCTLIIALGVWVEEVGGKASESPRHLSSEQLSRIIEKMRLFAGMPFDFSIQTDPESINLMVQIGDALTSAGLSWVPWHDNGPAAPIFTQPGKPQVGIVAFSGLAIQIDDSKTPEWGGAIATLRDALNSENVAASARRLTDSSVTTNAIHIYVGKKPQ